MKRRGREDTINAWWDRFPEERYWLEFTGRNDRDHLLATPRGDGGRPDFWIHRLITHVKEGDVVFHYDAALKAIVGWSISDGRVEKSLMSWSLPVRRSGDEPMSRRLPSWGISLRQATRLGTPVPLDEIARIQWTLFPALRAMEDEVGDPLYYPFEMGNERATHPLSGYLFKLPSVFVRAIPELASAADRVIRMRARFEHSTAPSAALAPQLHATSR
jgi:hypothetical protein